MRKILVLDEESWNNNYKNNRWYLFRTCYIYKAIFFHWIFSTIYKTDNILIAIIRSLPTWNPHNNPMTQPYFHSQCFKMMTKYLVIRLTVNSGDSNSGSPDFRTSFNHDALHPFILNIVRMVTFSRKILMIRKTLGLSCSHCFIQTN